jgi:hypothetical protein
MEREPMRTNANQGEIPLDAPIDVVLACKNEADAVCRCLTLALRRYGRDQQTIARMCGWKSDTCLSEAKREGTKRKIPKLRLHRFAVATGCNLLSQYRALAAAQAKAKGLTIQRDECERDADKCLVAWGIAA